MTLERFLLLIAPPLVLLSPLIGTMQHLSIPIFSAGSLYFLMGPVLVGFALGAIASTASGRKGQTGHAVAILALAITLVMLVDMAGGGLGHIGDHAFGKTAFLLLIVISSAALMWPIREHLALIFFSGAMALFGSTILVSSAHAETAEPPLIYIILDEMIGVEGIDRSLPGGEETYNSLREMLDKHHFRVYERAFSRHFFSNRAIPATLNYDEHDSEPASRYKASGETNLRLINDELAKGRSVVMFQSAHIDFCTGFRDVNCNTFPSFDPTEWSRNHADVSVRVVATAKLMQEAFKDSSFVHRYATLWRSALEQNVRVPDFFDIHGFPKWFSTFEDHVVSADADVYFAHFLMPHAPTIMSPQCEPQPRWEAGYYLYEVAGLSGPELDRARAEAYATYFEQVQCTIRTIDRFLERIEGIEEYDGAMIVLHGDHGSRISAGRFSENLSSRDMIDNFSTLFAVRGPEIEPGFDPQKISVQRLAANYFSGRSQEDLGPVNTTVVVESTAPDSVVLRDMPDF